MPIADAPAQVLAFIDRWQSGLGAAGGSGGTLASGGPRAETQRHGQRPSAAQQSNMRISPRPAEDAEFMDEL
jgi:hypothetical protein